MSPSWLRSTSEWAPSASWRRRPRPRVTPCAASFWPSWPSPCSSPSDPNTPAYGIVTTLVPPLRVLRYPVKIMVLVAFVWALLAGLGVDVWRERLRGRAFGLVLALVWRSSSASPRPSPRRHGGPPRLWRPVSSTCPRASTDRTVFGPFAGRLTVTASLAAVALLVALLQGSGRVEPAARRFGPGRVRAARSRRVSPPPEPDGPQGALRRSRRSWRRSATPAAARVYVYDYSVPGKTARYLERTVALRGRPKAGRLLAGCRGRSRHADVAGPGNARVVGASPRPTPSTIAAFTPLPSLLLEKAPARGGDDARRAAAAPGRRGHPRGVVPFSRRPPARGPVRWSLREAHPPEPGPGSPAPNLCRGSGAPRRRRGSGASPCSIRASTSGARSCWPMAKPWTRRPAPPARVASWRSTPTGWCSKPTSTARDTWFCSMATTPAGGPGSTDKRLPLHRANLAFRAVRVPAGRHRVEMAYRPRGLWLGLGVTALSLVALAAHRGRPLGRPRGGTMSRERLLEHRQVWAEKPVLAQVYRPWFDALLAQIPAGGRALEVGAGPGFLAEEARARRRDAPPRRHGRAPGALERSRGRRPAPAHGRRPACRRCSASTSFTTWLGPPRSSPRSRGCSLPAGGWRWWSPGSRRSPFPSTSGSTRRAALSASTPGIPSGWATAGRMRSTAMRRWSGTWCDTRAPSGGASSGWKPPRVRVLNAFAYLLSLGLQEGLAPSRESRQAPSRPSTTPSASPHP